MPSKLPGAIVDLAENAELRLRLAKEAVARPAKTWNAYAKEIATSLAEDRLSPPAATAPVAEAQSVYDELPALKRRPTLSVCISTYNRGKWLKVNLALLCEQLPQPSDDVEILVIDNTSTDNTEEVVQPYLSRRDFRYVRNPVNVGMLGNLRVTAHEARGQYVWILGDDDLVKEGAIKRVLAAIQQNPGVGLVYLNYSHTHVREPAEIGDIKQFLDSCPTLTPPGEDVVAPCEPSRPRMKIFSPPSIACVQA